MKYTANQAAKATGKAVPTITRAIKSGRLSAERDGKNLVIDAAELFRVFPPAKIFTNGTADDVTDEIAKSNSTQHNATPESAGNSRALQREIEVLREMLSRERDSVQDLRARLDGESDERRKLTAILTDQRPESERSERKLPWWKRPLW